MVEPSSARPLSSPWPLLCLRAFLLQRTRHLCTLVDCRLFSLLEQELVEAVRFSMSDVAVVNTQTAGLGEAAAIFDILKRRFPDIVTVACGEYPSQFPEHAASLPRTDFALSGDPEPILRDLLDRLDTPQRLSKVPGLGLTGQPAKEAYWLSDLRSLSLPDWEGVFWNAYKPDENESCKVVTRLSRGHTRYPADRAFGGYREPLRIWPMERFASAMQKCPPHGIGEVLLDDPPGFWTPERLQRWCRTLTSIRNVQPWALRLLPTHLTDDTLLLLAQSLCRRVEFLFPSCDPDLLRRHGCVIGAKDLASTLSMLEERGIAVHLRFWMGGPEESTGETSRVLHTIRQLACRSYSLEAFPLQLDAPVCEENGSSISGLLEEWLRWTVDPWMLERPSTLWGGRESAVALADAFTHIERSVRRSPLRLLRTAWTSLRGRNWISYMEERAVGLFTTPPNKSE